MRGHKAASRGRARNQPQITTAPPGRSHVLARYQRPDSPSRKLVELAARYPGRPGRLRRELRELDRQGELRALVQALPRYACSNASVAGALDTVWEALGLDDNATRGPISLGTCRVMVERRLGVNLTACEGYTWDYAELDALMRAASGLPFQPAVYGRVDSFESCNTVELGNSTHHQAYYDGSSRTISFADVSPQDAEHKAGASKALQESTTHHEVGHAVHEKHADLVDHWLTETVGFRQLGFTTLLDEIGVRVDDIDNVAQTQQTLVNAREQRIRYDDTKTQFPGVPTPLVQVYLRRGIARTFWGTEGYVVGDVAYLYEPRLGEFLAISKTTVDLAANLDSDYALKTPHEFFAEMFEAYYDTENRPFSDGSAPIGPDHFVALMAEIDGRALHEAEGLSTRLRDPHADEFRDYRLLTAMQRFSQDAELERLLTEELGITEPDASPYTAADRLIAARDSDISPRLGFIRFTMENQDRISQANDAIWRYTPWPAALAHIGYRLDHEIFDALRTHPRGVHLLHSVVAAVVVYRTTGDASEIEKLQDSLNDYVRAYGGDSFTLDARELANIEALAPLDTWYPGAPLGDRILGQGADGFVILDNAHYPVLLDHQYNGPLINSGGWDAYNRNDATARLLWWASRPERPPQEIPPGLQEHLR